VVVAVTSTVTAVPSEVVMVKVPSPTDETFPTALGGEPPKGIGGRPVCDDVEVNPDEGVVVDAAPATAPPPKTARPRATAAAVVTRTRGVRRRLAVGIASTAGFESMRATSASMLFMFFSFAVGC
jgi:hypothetical protein